MNNFILPLLKTSFLFICLAPSIGAEEFKRQTAEDLPELEKVSTAFVGDRIVSSRVGVQKYCITPKFSYERSYLSVVAGKPICKEDESNKNRYMPTYANDNTRSDGAPGKRRIIFENNKGAITFKFYRSRVSIKDLALSDFDIGKTFIPNEDSTQRFIEYKGKKGEVLVFLYEEHTGSSSIPSTREFEVDLLNGNVASFKGSVFEILDANNSKIEYKVLRHFK